LNAAPSIMQNFALIGRRSSEITRGNKQKKLEIWGKAQRESALRPMSDWGKLGG